MNVVLIVVAVWVAVDIAIICALSHLSGRRRADAVAAISARPSSVPARPSLVPMSKPMRLRLVGEPSTSVPDRRLRAVSPR